MRLIHTSDWHLGRTFHGASLHAEQAEFVDALVEIVTHHAADAVVIAGDLFDRAIPPLEAVALFEEAIQRLRSTGALVVATSGNHDSPRRVSVHDRLLATAGVTIRGDVSRANEPVLVTPHDGGSAVAVYPVPYLDPPSYHHPAVEGAPPERPTHGTVTRAVMNLVRADLASRPPSRSVVVAHTFLTGGAPSDSERELSIGNVEQVHLDVFDGFDYVALGHLHGAQSFDGGRVSYSGSPLPYSFGEEHQRKTVHAVTLAHDGTATVERIALGVGRRVRTLTGTLAQLLSDVGHTDAENARVRAVLTDPHLPRQAMVRLRRRFPHAVELRHEPIDRPVERRAPLTSVERRAAEPIELVEAFWSDQHGTAATPAERALLAEALSGALSASGPAQDRERP